MPVTQVKISPFLNAVIAKAYEKFCKTGSYISINLNELAEIADATKTDHNEIESQARQLINYGLLEHGDSFSYHATWTCLEAYERNYPDERVFKNNKIRRLIIAVAYEGRNNQRPGAGYITSDAFAKDERAKEYTEAELYYNVWFLEKMDVVKASLMSGMGFLCRLNDYTLATDTQRLAEQFPTSPNERISVEAVSDVIRGWTPRQKRRLEESYKAELAEYLRSHGFPKTREEEGQSNADILVDEVLPVEMKKDPNQGELDRMGGQMMRMLGEYGQVVACIIQTAPGLDRIERFKKTWELDERVRIIVKTP